MAKDDDGNNHDDGNDDKDKRNKEEYDVGYKKPPKHSQFPPGKSGNPKGRPKKEKDEEKTTELNIKKILTETIQEEILVQKNGKSEHKPKLKIHLEQLVNKALTGNQEASRELRLLMKEVDLFTAPPDPDEFKGGVLVIPGEPMTDDEWHKKYGGRKIDADDYPETQDE